MLVDYFKEDKGTSKVTHEQSLTISKDELNVMQYACGYKLLKRYETKQWVKVRRFVETWHVKILTLIY